LKFNNKVISTLEDDSVTLINWFSINKMKANPEKFQAIAIGKQTKQQNLTFTIDGNKIEMSFSSLWLYRRGSNILFTLMS
jgi:hypothetical protein